MVTRLPCHTHRWHDLGDHETGRVVATLTALFAEARVDPDDLHADCKFEDELMCPLEALELSWDAECFLEHATDAVLDTGAVRSDPGEGLVVVPWGQRDPQDNGDDSESVTAP